MHDIYSINICFLTWDSASAPRPGDRTNSGAGAVACTILPPPIPGGTLSGSKFDACKSSTFVVSGGTAPAPERRTAPESQNELVRGAGRGSQNVSHGEGREVGHEVRRPWGIIERVSSKTK